MNCSVSTDGSSVVNEDKLIMHFYETLSLESFIYINFLESNFWNSIINLEKKFSFLVKRSHFFSDTATLVL